MNLKNIHTMHLYCQFLTFRHHQSMRKKCRCSLKSSTRMWSTWTDKVNPLAKWDEDLRKIWLNTARWVSANYNNLTCLLLLVHRRIWSWRLLTDWWPISCVSWKAIVFWILWCLSMQRAKIVKWYCYCNGNKNRVITLNVLD